MIELESSLIEVEFSLMDVVSLSSSSLIELLMESPLIEALFSLTKVEILPSSSSNLFFISGNQMSH